MKKIKVYNLLIFIAGLVFLSLGVVLVIKSNLGVSVATSPPYILSLHFTKITFGQWNYIAHGFVLMLLVLFIKKLTLKYLMSFIVSFLFGVTIDLFNLILVSVQGDTLIGRLGLFALGSITISIGVASFIKSNYPILPFDTFVKEISMTKGIKLAKFKTSFDLVCFTISLLLSLIFFKEVKGIGIGTFVSAVILGGMIGACIKVMNNRIDGKAILPEDQVRLFMEYNFLEIFGRYRGASEKQKTFPTTMEK
jgi:uncharacterized protein